MQILQRSSNRIAGYLQVKHFLA